MAIQPIALGVQTPQINAMDQFASGATNATNIKSAQLEQARAGLETIGSLALGAMGGDLNGQADPGRFEQGLDMLSQQGINVEAFRGRADLAPLIARSSMTAVQQVSAAQNQQQLDQALAKFELDLMEAAKAGKAAPKTETIFDPESGREMKVQWDEDLGGWVELGGVKGGEDGNFTTLTSEEANALGLDPAKVYQRGPDGKISDVGGSLVTVQMPGESTNTFFKGLADAERGNYETMLANGQNAGRTLAQLDQLEGLLENSPQGFEAAATQFAGNLGIDLGNATGVQAATALINQMVPAQRPPGSGPMSDADLELFKQSVPRLINQPGGNQLIINTMRQINTYDQALANIIQEHTWRGEMAETDEEAVKIRREMRDAIAELQNPLVNFNDRISQYERPAATGNAGDAPEGITADEWGVMTPEERALWQN